MKNDSWQEAVAKAMGAKKCSPVERVRSFQMLHDTGIGYSLGGQIADTLRHMVASGVVKDNTNAA